VRALLCSTMIAGAAAVSSGQTPAPPSQPAATPPAFEETIEVVGATPIHGIGIDRDRIPGNVQTVSADVLAQTGGISVGEQMNLAMPSVHVNEATTNAFQPDLHFRGFVGSPLLGLPQGLAVYQNGVRLNEPFGDTMNWDLVPANAIGSINLMPGSNPLFGLNALGGAVSVQTKTGFSHPGHDVAISGGAFGRYMLEAATGGSNGGLSYFAAGSALTEDGWRDFSPSRVRQLFGDVEWRSGATSVGGSVTTAVNRLIGNGAAPIQLLDEDRSAIFTHPDETNTNMTLLSFRGRHHRGTSVSFDGMFFYRRASLDTFNGDDSADADDEFDGAINTSSRLSNGWGGGFQATVATPLSGLPNHFVAGLSIDEGRTNYAADTEIARLTDDRGAEGTGQLDPDAAVRLRTTVRHLGVYAANFLTVAPRLTLMGAARFNVSDVTLRDQIGTALNGDHDFARLNPAAGVTFELTRAATVYGSFSTSSRVPAPSELSCADREDPCRLPNAFVADPPLDQVVAGTWEGGIRGRTGAMSWNASGFRTAASDDILFVSSGPLTNTGHFQNIGDTLRQGLELAASGGRDRIRWNVAYSLVSATFDTPLTLSSPNHPDEADGEIEVAPGSRIPGVPLHNLKVNLSTTIGRLTLGGGVQTASSQYLRGDEANQLAALDGFSVVNIVSRYAISRNVTLTARVTNLFDAEYSTFGLLGEADDVLGDDYDDPRFLSPAAPRAAWVGLQCRFR
jgi:outer membrane receptor protein involved in Fe transport